MDWDTDVHLYFSMFANGFPEELRPKSCPLCKCEDFQQKHARFTRSLQTLSELFTLTIYRFLCPMCKTTHSVVPSFFRPKHTLANEVQELVVNRLDNGEALQAAGESICSGVTVSRETARRWNRFWGNLMAVTEEVCVQQVLILAPALLLPVGKATKAVEGSLYKWLSYILRQSSGTVPAFDSTCLFTVLFRLHLSMSAAVVP